LVLGHAERVEYLKQSAEISELERNFQQNVAKENGGMWFTLEEFDGVPKDELAKWKDGCEDIAESKRKFVPFTNGGTLAILTNSHVPGTRKKMFLADYMKLKENKPLFEEVIKRRAKQAHLLNYPTLQLLE
jgi:metallopeptidase MepB